MNYFTPIYKVFIPYNEPKRYKIKTYENKFKPTIDYFYIKDIFADLTLDKEIKEKTEKIIPTLCTELTNKWTESWVKEWVPKNLKIEVDTMANKFMKENIENIVYRHMTENSGAMNIISDHLKSVEETIDNAINTKIHQIIESDSETNPVIQYQVKYLTDQYEKQLDLQNEEILELKKSLDNISKDQLYFNKNNTNDILYIYSFLFCFACLFAIETSMNRCVITRFLKYLRRY